MLVGPNTGLGHNSIIFMIEAQVNYIMDGLAALKKRRADILDVKQEAFARFNAEVQEQLQGTVWTSGCSSWYQQADGKNTVLWPFSTWRYWLRTRKLPDQDYLFTRAGKNTALAGHQRKVSATVA